MPKNSLKRNTRQGLTKECLDEEGTAPAERRSVTAGGGAAAAEAVGLVGRKRVAGETRRCEVRVLAGGEEAEKAARRIPSVPIAQGALCRATGSRALRTTRARVLLLLMMMPSAKSIAGRRPPPVIDFAGALQRVP